jgi:hypothetical protein
MLMVMMIIILIVVKRMRVKEQFRLSERQDIWWRPLQVSVYEWKNFSVHGA